MSEFWTDKQKQNLKFFEDNLNDFLKDDLLRGKFLVVCDKKICNSLDTFESALAYASDNLPIGEFIIQEVVGKEDVVSYLCLAR